ncbi:aldo/keto reductase [Salinimonas marina]|uniref:Aldo/keto reductase n=2 Tax=Salinimonas marina TaxID=2785918 RepID=A0A7S9E021_9ALTE|nr:aldo/keto reductase [Salinimonas marina]
MKTRTLGKSDLPVTPVGLGCWQLGGDFGPITEASAHEVIHSALDEGIRFFDTADVYGAGQSEHFLGEVLSSQWQDAVVATKYGRSKGVFPDGYSFNSMRDSVLRSQDRLQRDQIDLLQLHCIPHAQLKQGHVFDWLEELKLEGQIRYYGASVETLDEAQTCLQYDGLTSLQLIFNMFRQSAADSLLDNALRKQVGVIARVPLASGLLCGKFDKDTEFNASDHRQFNRQGEAFNVGETFAGMEYETGLRLVSELARDFKPKHLKMPEFALRWILDHPAISCVIPGASRPEQVVQNVTAATLPNLDATLHQRLNAFYEQKIKAHIQGQI